ncbi:MAG TPA: RIP metalloprotease RseP [Ideonella sp.]|uniref:RIP metalloprotease RseP n=1 Tax=Ideonella sp. TaxID=1929293 RepID=UPI002B6695F5|nr:RIP metalloprotease RseP [Ideonella sp.]HSI49536.1 RIP metalloprotease RseP [Ideonella sp.]
MGYYFVGIVLMLGILIPIHEYGHYRVARWWGVRILRFSIGFGPVLWRRQASPDATEFTLSALPLGGYVRMLDSREGPVDHLEVGRAFDRQPLRARISIVLAGPLANLALAVLLYAAVGWLGNEEPRAVLATPPANSLAEKIGLQAGDQVVAVSRGGQEWRELSAMSELQWALMQALLDGQPLQLQVTNQQGERRHTLTLPLDQFAGQEPSADVLRLVGIGAPFREPMIDAVLPGGAAAQAGLQAGDRVLSIDGESIRDAQMLLDRIKGAGSLTVPVMQWQVERAQQRLLLVVEPRKVTEAGRTIGRIEAQVGAPESTTLVQLGFWDGLGAGWTRTGEMAWTSLRMLGRVATGQASLRNISGPLTMADYAGKAIKRGLVYYLAYLAFVSVSLGVLNLLPLPMLDGGHLIYYLFEAVTGRPVSDQWLTWLQRGGALVLLLMMSIALSNDVARFLGLQ